MSSGKKKSSRDETDVKAGGWKMNMKSPMEETVKYSVACQDSSQEASIQEIGLKDDDSLRHGNFPSSQGSKKELGRAPSQNNDSGISSMSPQNSFATGAFSWNPQLSPDALNYDISYKMNHRNRGLFVIMNNTRFKKETQMPDRAGSDADAGNLYRLFKTMGFEIVLKNNQTTLEMLQIMVDVAKQDHSQNDCFALAILSHGDNGFIYGTDGTIKLEALTEPIKGKGCRSLLGKPKLIFIQCCRGEELDDGVELNEAMDVSDAVPDAQEEKVQKIPAEADFLYAYSTAPGYFSFRNNTKGSWFVQALTNVFEKFGNKLELVRLLTFVNREVATKFESRSRQKEHSRKKQIPSFVSMLTKELYFVEKK